MQSLKSMTAFNVAYRSSWSDYFSHTPSGRSRDALLGDLKEGLDRESRQIIDMHARIITNLQPSALFDGLHARVKIRSDLLSDATRGHLEEVGLLHAPTRKRRLEALTAELGLAETVLPEFLCHCGLTYVPKEIRKGIAGKTVIDGGAYTGDSAILFTRLYKTRRVYAFEANPLTFQTLKDNAAAWDLEHIIKPQNFGLHSRRSKMRVWGEGLGSSTLEKPTASGAPILTVKTISIDEFAKTARLEDLGLIKLDVEGAELETVQGARATIEAFRPLMILSIYHTAKDFYEIKPLIESWGLGYEFMVRKMTDDLIKEIVLICIPR